MKRWTWGLTMTVVMGGAALLPGRADAQVSVRVDLSWVWGDGGWRAYEPTYEYGPEPVVVYEGVGRRFRVPAGHLPPPGYCRLWYPGVPPGQQPPPERCNYLLRAYAHDGAVIIGARVGWDVYGSYYLDGRYERYDRDDRYRRGERYERERYEHDRYQRPGRGKRGKKGRGKKKGRGRG